jgi:hypothetical protein
MNWILLLPLLVTTALAIGSWFFGHWLSTSRDRANKKRDLRLSFLLEAYRRLENGGSRDSIANTDFAAGFESAIADIQLLGTTEQIVLAKNMIYMIARGDPQASSGLLLLSLRDELREYLDLDALNEAPVHFRLKPKA